MAHYTPGTDAAGTFRTARNTTLSVINEFYVLGVACRMYARTVTTTVEFRGLTKSAALAMAESADYNYNDKHGVRYGNGSTIAESMAFMSVPMCEGAECRADARRINDADMWRVVVTYSNTTVTHSSWTARETF